MSDKFLKGILIGYVSEIKEPQQSHKDRDPDTCGRF